MTDYQKSCVYIAVVLAFFLICTTIIRFHLTPALHGTAMGVLAFACALIVFGVFIKEHSDTPGEVIRDIALAFLFAIFFQTLHISPEAKGRFSFTYLLDELSARVPTTLAMVIVVFSIGLVGRAARHAAKAAKDLKELNKVAEEFKEGAQHHRYADLAANILNLPNSQFLKTPGRSFDPEPDKELLDALEPGVGALRTWVRQGNIGNAESSDHCCRSLWWHIMRIYQQEEIYDTARYELATNVRNFAFILLSIISGLRNKIEDEQQDSTAKVVVVNCTPFAPKDFYNYPDGLADERFYHEREFFGTYRRVLTSLAQDKQKIEMYRILLADPAVEWPESSQQSAKNLAVGWPLDPIWDLARDCARFFILPAPLSLGDKPYLLGSESLDDPFKFLLAPRFPKGHDPRKQLTGSKKCLWMPLFADLRFGSKQARPEAGSTNSQWWERPKNFEAEMQGSRSYEPKKLRLTQARGQSEGLQQEVSRHLRTAVEEAKDALERELAQICLGNREERPSRDLIEQVKRYLERNSKHSTLPASDIIRLAEEWKVLRKITALDRLESSDIYTLNEVAQSIDSKIEMLAQVLGVKQLTAENKIGYAEQYLHRFLAFREWDLLANDFKESGPFPVWELFFADCLLGHRWSQKRAELDKYFEEAAQRFKVVPARDFAKNPKKDDEEFFWKPIRGTRAEQLCNPKRFKSGEILPEFLLVGERSDGEGLDNVEWRTLVAASMNEPFDTCRVLVRFPDAEATEQMFKEHVDWVTKVFSADAEGGRFCSEATEEFFNQLQEQIKDTDYLDYLKDSKE